MEGFKDVYTCISCSVNGQGMDEFKCGCCGAHACQHLVLIDGGMVFCFVCYKDKSRTWPDWSYTLLPEK
jgi:hypothetical protein